MLKTDAEEEAHMNTCAHPHTHSLTHAYTHTHEIGMVRGLKFDALPRPRDDASDKQDEDKEPAW